MSKPHYMLVEWMGLGALICAVLFSLWFGILKSSEMASKQPKESGEVSLAVDDRIEAALQMLHSSHASRAQERRLFSSEARVAAIGSAYPIAYEAEVCPFSGIPQPKLNQLDLDDDGMIDAWEEKYGFNRKDRQDAFLDADEDGFTNLAEFKAKTDPHNAELHPPYILHWRLKETREKVFDLRFDGGGVMPGGRMAFQVYDLRGETPKPLFVGIGDQVGTMDIRLIRHEPSVGGAPERLVFARNGKEIIVAKGKVAKDPESEVVFINILDQRTKIGTMGALLSLHSEIYEVIGIADDHARVRFEKTGETFKVKKISEEERQRSSEGLK